MKIRSLLFGVRPSLLAWASCFFAAFSLGLALRAATGAPWLVVGAEAYLELIGSVVAKCLLTGLVVKALLLIRREPPTTTKVKAGLTLSVVSALGSLLSFHLPTATPHPMECLFSWLMVGSLCVMNVWVNGLYFAPDELRNLLYRREYFLQKHKARVADPFWLRELKQTVPNPIPVEWE